LEGLRKVTKTLPEDAACGANYEAGIRKHGVGLLSSKPRVLFGLNYFMLEIIIRSMSAKPVVTAENVTKFPVNTD
jgi:hypothetical protein